jgi:hypothetical protein
MVGITVDCRLGNQLFQYAFIKHLSEKLGTSFYANEKLGRFIAPDYFDLKGYHKLINPLKRVIFKFMHEHPLQPLQSIPVGNYNAAEIEKLADRELYRGYFQSPLFFGDIAAHIGSYIRVKQKFQQEFRATYQQLFSENRIIAIHIRRGDYLNLNDWWQQNLGSNNLSLPASYYEDCISKVNVGRNDKLLFVSDDAEFVANAFSHIPNSLFVRNDAITDFQIMMNADVCIIANSSFAWWAAYLNAKKHKQVFCPQYWLGFKIKKEYPANIIPPDWTQVAVNTA